MWYAKDGTRVLPAGISSILDVSVGSLLILLSIQFTEDQKLLIYCQLLLWDLAHKIHYRNDLKSCTVNGAL